MGVLTIVENTTQAIVKTVGNNCSTNFIFNASQTNVIKMLHWSKACKVKSHTGSFSASIRGKDSTIYSGIVNKVGSAASGEWLLSFGLTKASTYTIEMYWIG